MAAYLISLKGNNVFKGCVNIGVTTDPSKLKDIITNNIESKYNIEFESEVIQKYKDYLTYPCKDSNKDINLVIEKMDLL